MVPTTPQVEEWYRFKIGPHTETRYGVARYDERDTLCGLRAEVQHLGASWFIVYDLRKVKEFTKLSEKEVFALQLAGKL